VVGFSIDVDTGALARVPGSPFAAGIAPWSIEVDPYAKFVYAANAFFASSNLSAYTVNRDSGELTPWLSLCCRTESYIRESCENSILHDPACNHAFHQSCVSMASKRESVASHRFGGDH
jgi:hypothetical protein